MVTLKQLAEQLNVSVSTVSKALNGSYEISDETIKRVKELADMMNYRPNKMALSLKHSKTFTIGVIVPDILNHFFAKVLYGIEQEATELGYNIITCLSNESFDKEVNSLEFLANGSVDGFILAMAEETQVLEKSEHFDTILNQKFPMVMFDRVNDSIACDKVIIDDFNAAYNATTHLLKEGRRKIVLLTGIDELSVGKLRVKGYEKALKDFSGYTAEPFVLKVNTIETANTEIGALFDEEDDIDGILGIDNSTGVMALINAQKRNINVPKDMSIIGFSASNVLPFTDPKLSTVSQNAIKMGKKAVNILVEKLKVEEEAPIKTHMVETKLILRGTTL
ncbi:MAG: LacI family transcriptional regulator [Bacteroidetes bacterium MedPE-SWsnd-G2]|nr:MAG: LacI family transcriptional regulator [Bacteroidetes bacterium MedPE-SWsnd-G2]